MSRVTNIDSVKFLPPVHDKYGLENVVGGFEQAGCIHSLVEDSASFFNFLFLFKGLSVLSITHTYNKPIDSFIYTTYSKVFDIIEQDERRSEAPRGYCPYESL